VTFAAESAEIQLQAHQVNVNEKAGLTFRARCVAIPASRVRNIIVANSISDRRHLDQGGTDRPRCDVDAAHQTTPPVDFEPLTNMGWRHQPRPSTDTAQRLAASPVQLQATC